MSFVNRLCLPERAFNFRLAEGVPLRWSSLII